jgi:hypothetical protein
MINHDDHKANAIEPGIRWASSVPSVSSVPLCEILLLRIILRKVGMCNER